MKIVSSLERDSAIRRANAVKYLQSLGGQEPPRGPSGKTITIILVVVAITYVLLKLFV